MNRFVWPLRIFLGEILQPHVAVLPGQPRKEQFVATFPIEIVHANSCFVALEDLLSSRTNSF